ncbi:MAG: MFS transporter [Ktedonobacteraceae bacterium]
MALTAPQGGFITLLKNKNFLRLWLAQLISLTILFASNYGLLVLIEEVTGSTTLVGLAIISFSLPALLFGAPAGVYVDRMNKRRVLWGSNCLRAIATFAFVVALLLNRHQLIPIYLLTFLISCIGQFFTPAEGSSIPLLVDEDELVPALSLFNITLMLAQALGFLLFAPLILSLLPTFKIFSLVIDPVESLYTSVAVLYVVCAILIAMIPSESFSQRARETRKPVNTQNLEIVSNMWTEMYQGWSFVRRNKQLFLAVIQLSFAGVLLLVIGELATPIVTQLLHLPAKEMAFVFAPAGIGLVTGSILMPRIARRLGKSRAVFIGSVVLALTTLLIPLITLLAQALQPDGWNTNPLLLLAVALLMFLAGFALDFINIPALTAIQELTPDWIKGRVLALQLVLYNACAIPVILFIGAFADLFGLDRVIYFISICELAFGLWGIYYERKHPLVIPDIDQKEVEKTIETVNLPGKP